MIGIRGFYRGLVPGVIRVMPMSAVVLMSYERILKILNKNVLMLILTIPY